MPEYLAEDPPLRSRVRTRPPTGTSTGSTSAGATRCSTPSSRSAMRTTARSGSAAPAAAICGSCGVRMNGKPGLACNTHLEEAAARAHGTGWNPGEGEGTGAGEGAGTGEGTGAGEGTGGNGSGAGDTTPAGVIVVEPMGNMPVINDLIVDMDAVHWKKIQRVTPWLINKQPVPEREYIVPHDNMADVTQTMACIQCGACVSDCLSMEVDPLFVGPAALAKAYRFVGDPRDAEHHERLNDLSEDPHGIYDCTHCFNCIDACPKGVVPMSQIMRLRRRAGNDEKIVDLNNGHRHEEAFVTLSATTACSRGRAAARAATAATRGSASSTRPPARSCCRRCRPSSPACARQGEPQDRHVRPQAAQGDPTARQEDLRRDRGRPQRVELNLYVSGYEDEPVLATSAARRAETRPPRAKARSHEGRLLARLREPRVHAGAARVDGQGRAAARHRAGRARPRRLLRRGRDRRAQPGARRHPQRPHVRAGPADRRRADDEHLLDVPGLAVGVPGAPRRQHRVPRPHQRDPRRRGPRVRKGASPTRTSCGCWSRRSAWTRCTRRSSVR